MFWLALAAQFAAATLAGSRGPFVGAIFGADDMPVEVQMQGITRTVYARVTVRPDGTTQGCVTETSSGKPKLDAYTCGLILKRARFEPAKWLDGSPVYGVIRTPVVWAIGLRPSRKSMDGDLNLTINQFPHSVESPHFERLNFAVDEVGHISSCGPSDDWSVGMDKSNPDLAQVACDQLQKNFRPTPAVDDAGHPSRSIQNASVRFEN